jgi:hypothetical protein
VGLPRDTQLARKVWEVSRLLSKLPTEVLDLPEVWLDWCLTMEQDYPEGSTKFTRASDVEDRVAFTSSAVGWSDVLTGSALSRFYDTFVPAFLRKGKSPKKVDGISR